MATRLEHFPEESPAPTRYAWDEWTDGSPWEIRQGEDYEITTENMRANLHMRAESTGKKVRTKKISAVGAEGLVFQFSDPEEEEPQFSDPEEEELKKLQAKEHQELKMKLQAMGKDTAQAAINALYRDAMDIYNRARQEVVAPRRDGRPRKRPAVTYRAKILRGYDNRELVPAIATIIAKRRTSGFDRLAAAGRDDLTLERIIVDETKPYHQLFSTTTVATARERLAELEHSTTRKQP